jgi:hypothetical protein
MKVHIKKRHAIGERAPYIIMFMLTYSVASGAVNTLQLFNYSSNVSVQNAQFSSTVSNQITCQTVTVGQTVANCSPNVGNLAQSSSSVLVFGNWWGAITILYQFFTGMLLPVYILPQYGIPAVWAGLFGFVASLCWVFLIIWIMSGRPV